VADLTVGEEFAGHRIERVLGRGGMGVVYLAEHLRLGRKVAIKVLSPDLASDEAFRRRFLRESRAAAALEHPNIVPVFDAGEVAEAAYISMRFVDGSDLSAFLEAHGPLDPEMAVAITGQVASALDAAHAEGLVHCDVKPANVLLESVRAGPGEWRAFLTDFGITKRLTGARTTQAGQFIGTLDYMAPEQITGGSVDGRTDQYSLACMLFQCLTGQVPFPRDDQVVVMYGHLQEPVPQASDRRTGLPRGIDGVIQRGMAKRPDRRFSSCSELVEAARRQLGVALPGPGGGPTGRTRRAAGQGLDAPAARPGSTSWARRPIRTRVAIATALAVIVAAVATGVVVLTHEGTSGPPGLTDEGAITTVLWQRVPDPQTQLGGAHRQVIDRAAVGDSKVVAVGFEDASTRDAGVWVSRDDATWRREFPGTAVGSGDQAMNAVVYTGAEFVAVGTSTQGGGLARPAVWRSRDGESWRADERFGALADADYGQSIRQVIRSGDELLAAGWDSRLGNRDAAVWRFDGSVWTRETLSGEDGGQELWGITESGSSGFIAVGSDSGDAAVWRSPDGEEWDRVSRDSLEEPGEQVMKAVVADGDELVAVGSDDRTGSPDAAVWTSADGVRWARHRPESDLGGPGFQEMNDVIPYRGGLIAVGTSERAGERNAGVWVAPDGSEWRLSDSTALAGAGAQEINDILVFHGLLVAVGRDEGSDGGDAAVWIGTPFHTGRASAVPSATS
jgi:Protein kinase domain